MLAIPRVGAGAGILAFSLITFAAQQQRAQAEPGGAKAPSETAAVTIVTLGDSITKGARTGVKPSETFAALVQDELLAKGITARVVNVGIGGERTDQALRRLDADVLSHRPRIVTIMYGTNDSYIDRGKTESRLSVDAYRDNLRSIVSRLRMGGVEPVLMTEPRWADDADPNGVGEHPNLRLDPYIAACRQVARERDVPLVDHFARWTRAEKDGRKLREWTTDGCHPNPRGHRELAALMLPTLAGELAPPAFQPTPVRIERNTVLKHDDGKFLWFHPRVAAIPGLGRGGDPAVVMTIQKHLQVSDYYSGLSVLRTDDLGATWTNPDERPELDWVRDDGIIIAVADVTPGWHALTGKLLAIGARVRYSPEGKQLEDKARSHQTAYAVSDPKTGAWSRWKTLRMPADEKFEFARSACAQWLVEPDGTVLAPFYFGRNATDAHSVTVVRCSFDGETLKYLEHGDEFALSVDRGLVEPSLVRFEDRYYLTIRNDRKGYVTTGADGLHYRTIRPWTFDDGIELGSYNTQQHWLVVGDGLFLSYTRRGANNDHIFRHRAPLFIAQVDPRTLRVVRATEKVLVAERGATLGNFGAARISDRESWVTVAEGVWNDKIRARGAEGAVFVAKVIAGKPTSTSAQAASKDPDYRWVNVTMKAPFAPRDGAGALIYKNKMWLLGGWNPSDKNHFPRICSNDVWNSQDGADWTLIKPNTFRSADFDPKSDWEGRHTAGYAVHRDKMWIVGGDVNQGHYQNDVWNSTDGKRWNLVNEDRDVPWGPRALHYTLAFKDKIWVIGGQTMPAFGPAKEIFYRDVWNTTDGVHWERVTPKEPFWPQRGMIGASAVFDGRMWILGGGTYDTPTTPTRQFRNDVWSSPDGVHWTKHVESAPWAARQYHEVAVWDGRLWVMEGYAKRSGNRKDVWHSADGVHWQELPDTPWKPRHAASVFVYDDALWMVAGNNMESDVWKLVRK